MSQLTAKIGMSEKKMMIQLDKERFQIVIEKEAEDQGYLAYSPTVPGCFSNGKTVEEARRNIREAIKQHISSLVAHGHPISRRIAGTSAR